MEGDRWSLRFWRLVQIVGLLMIVLQALVSAAAKIGLLPNADSRAEPWLLLVALGLILGGQGVHMVFSGVLRILAGGLGGEGRK